MINVYVKEYKNFLTVSMVCKWLKENIRIKEYSKKEELSSFDIVMVSQKDPQKDLQTYAKIICYEECIEIILRNCRNELYINYDYHFLKNSLDVGEKEAINIVAGSSYGLFGVDADKLDATVNCSLSSQDIFYSCRIIYDICLKNSCIQNVIFICSYYILYSDLSLTQNLGERTRIRDVYYPLFNDMHNSLFTENKTCYYPDSLIFDMDKVMYMVEKTYLSKTYFSKERSRRAYAFRNWENDLNWQDLSEDTRVLCGRKRAESHAESMRYKKSYYENLEYLKELSSFCLENGITLTFMIAPASKYYRKYENPEFKDKFYEALQMLPGTVHVIDLHDSEMFQLEDFNDMDHLGDAGAEKMTQVLKEYLEN